MNSGREVHSAKDDLREWNACEPIFYTQTNNDLRDPGERAENRLKLFRAKSPQKFSLGKEKTVSGRGDQMRWWVGSTVVLIPGRDLNIQRFKQKKDPS